MSTRKLNWYESEYDNRAIAANGWRFQVAKSVASASTTPNYNIIWQSLAVAPSTSVSWQVEYALGWTAEVPSSGVAVTIRGKWQKCNKGESYDVNDAGYWEKSAKAPDTSGTDWLDVGEIRYSYPGVLGIHIVIGVLNATSREFEPIFIDTAALPEGSSGRYQPQETVSWWLEANDLTGQVFNKTKSRSTSYDFSNPSNPATGAYEWSTSYVMREGKWTITLGRPPQIQSGPPPSARLSALSLGGDPPVKIQPYYTKWLVTFAVPLGGAFLINVPAALYQKLKDSFKEVNVSFVGTDGTELKIQYKAVGGTEAGTVEFLGTPVGVADGPEQTIDSALSDLKTNKTIPDNETWTIEGVLDIDGLSAPDGDATGLSVSNGDPSKQNSKP